MKNVLKWQFKVTRKLYKQNKSCFFCVIGSRRLRVLPKLANKRPIAESGLNNQSHPGKKQSLYRIRVEEKTKNYILIIKKSIRSYFQKI